MCVCVSVSLYTHTPLSHLYREKGEMWDISVCLEKVRKGGEKLGENWCIYLIMLAHVCVLGVCVCVTCVCVCDTRVCV